MAEATKGAESIVTVTMEPRGDQTEVTLRHSGVPDDEMGRQHKDGWPWVLSALAETLASHRPASSSDKKPPRNPVAQPVALWEH
jgi:hypothetical protein